MASKTNLKIELDNAKTVDHTSVGSSYVAVGMAVGTPSLGVIITSTFDKTILLSTDGTSDKILIAPQQVYSLPLSLFVSNQGAAFPSGTQFYVKQGPDGAPSTGDLSITFIYGRA